MYSYQKAREQFIAKLAHLVPHGTLSDARAFLREATAQQRWNEIECSIQISDTETARQEKREVARCARVKALADKLGLGLEMNGDPRGEPYTLLIGERMHRIGIPGHGLPARCFQ